MTEELVLRVVDNLKSPNVVGLSILGGEPMHPKNLEGVALLTLSSKLLENNKDIWLWTGYTFEELLSRRDILTMNILNLVDIIIDGKFESDKKDLSLKYRGSSNQRVIDVKKSLRQNRVVLFTE